MKKSNLKNEEKIDTELKSPKSLDIKSYQNCSICRTIPDKSDAFWKGGELQGNPLPPSEAKLEVVGAPFYDASTSYTHSCIKRCPECGTCYIWEIEYEYLVNGSEDEIILTRLSESDAKKEIDRIYNKIKINENEFIEKSPIHIESLHNLDSHKKLEEAIRYFRENQKKRI